MNYVFTKTREILLTSDERIVNFFWHYGQVIQEGRETKASLESRAVKEWLVRPDLGVWKVCGGHRGYLENVDQRARMAKWARKDL